MFKKAMKKAKKFVKELATDIVAVPTLLVVTTISLITVVVTDNFVTRTFSKQEA